MCLERSQAAQGGGGEHLAQAALDVPVAEFSQQRRQHGQGADERGEDDEHRPDPDRGEDVRAGKQQAGHRDQHRDPGDQDRLPGGRGGAEESLVSPVAGCALLALALEIEQRVVDPDGHPHQQDHRLGRIGGMKNVAGKRREPDRPQHGREGEQDRYARGDERAERDQQDREGDRYRQLLRVLEILVDRLAQLVLRARKAELRDGEARARALKAGDSVEHGCTRASAVSRLPFMSNSISCARRSLET